MAKKTKAIEDYPADAIARPAYQTRYEDGVFIGVVIADRCPVTHKGWIVPGAAYLDAPPPFDYGKQARRAGAKWIIENAPVQTSFVTFDGLEHLCGVLIKWDGEARDTMHVMPPTLEPHQMAEWTGKKWEVRNKPKPKFIPMPKPPEYEG